MTTKIFTHAIIGTNSMDSTIIIRTGLWRLIPSLESHQGGIMEEACFPAATAPFPQDVKDGLYASGPMKSDYAYAILAREKCICVADASMLSVKWLHALKQDGHGVIMYGTEGCVDGEPSLVADLYHFSTWENGQMKPRGTFSVQQQKWIDEPKPINSWQFRPAA